MSKYNEIMKHLNPRVIIAKTETPHDEARATFPMQSSIVRNHAEFDRLIINYIAHDTKKDYGSPLPQELCLDKARKLLDQAIGYDNAVFLGLSGNEGGSLTVLNHLNDGLKQEARYAYYRYILDSHIDSLNFEEVVGLMREFKARIGAYSPDSFGYISAEAMAGNYRDIFWNYIQSLPKYKNLWAY